MQKILIMIIELGLLRIDVILSKPSYLFTFTFLVRWQTGNIRSMCELPLI
ncbi:hypothetical protein LPPLD21_00082 [Lactiplantibacillus paraplantarum]|uniref:Uncharacterized protein n=1 Tax=Lactiplantibacillus paraplantarum TaxID=60520 RepID=A0ABQ0N657_9LACO|nr:hypothetical protein CK401_00482 [Lactiplantibacillus paraplantarum]GBF00582.1 hypothetical protein LPPLD21_00082 [Lactiplantibacillus paraplantarum]